MGCSQASDKLIWPLSGNMVGLVRQASIFYFGLFFNHVNRNDPPNRTKGSYSCESPLGMWLGWWNIYLASISLIC